MDDHCPHWITLLEKTNPAVVGWAGIWLEPIDTISYQNEPTCMIQIRLWIKERSQWYKLKQSFCGPAEPTSSCNYLMASPTPAYAESSALKWSPRAIFLPPEIDLVQKT